MSSNVALEILINIALPDLREIVWHTDGRLTAKTGSRAVNPKKLYTGKTPSEALAKLIDDRELTECTSVPEAPTPTNNKKD